MASLSPERATKGARPTSKTRHPTAPSVMTVNGHFANVGEKPTKEHFEHGIQVINEVQEFKYFIGHPTSETLLTILCTPVLHSLATYPSRRSLKLASITTSYLSLGPNRRGNQRFSTIYSAPSSALCRRQIGSKRRKASGCRKTSGIMLMELLSTCRLTFWSWTLKAPMAGSEGRIKILKGRALCLRWQQARS